MIVGAIQDAFNRSSDVSRSDVLDTLASRLDFAIGIAKKELKGSDLVKFVSPLEHILQKLLDDLGTAVTFTPGKDIDKEDAVRRLATQSTTASCDSESTDASSPIHSEPRFDDLIFQLEDYVDQDEHYEQCPTSLSPEMQTLQFEVSHKSEPLCCAAPLSTMYAHQWIVSVEAVAFQEFEFGEMLDFIDKVSFKAPGARVLKFGRTDMDEDDIESLPDVLVVNESPFDLIATSWNPVAVEVTIYWRQILDKPPTCLQYFVDFHHNLMSKRSELHAVHLTPKHQKRKWLPKLRIPRLQQQQLKEANADEPKLLDWQHQLKDWQRLPQQQLKDATETEGLAAEPTPTPPRRSSRRSSGRRSFCGAPAL